MWERRTEMSAMGRSRYAIAMATGSDAGAEDAAGGAEMAGGDEMAGGGGALGWIMAVSSPDIADTRFIGSEILPGLLRRL